MDYIKVGRVKLTLPSIKSTPKDKWVKLHNATCKVDKETLGKIWDDVNGTTETKKSPSKNTSGSSANGSSKSKKTRRPNPSAK